MTVEVAHDDFACALVWVVLPVGRAVLVSFHRIGLSTACLPVGEYRGMEAVDDFLNQAWDLKALKYVFLAVLAIEYLVERVVLSCIAVLLEYAQLVFLSVNSQQLLRMPLLLLVW